jgi:hypothetical protein
MLIDEGSGHVDGLLQMAAVTKIARQIESKREVFGMALEKNVPISGGRLIVTGRVGGQGGRPRHFVDNGIRGFVVVGLTGAGSQPGHSAKEARQPSQWSGGRSEG